MWPVVLLLLTFTSVALADSFAVPVEIVTFPPKDYRGGEVVLVPHKLDDEDGHSGEDSDEVDVGEVALHVDQVKNRKCLLPLDPGPCRNFIPSYYYDAAERACKLFIFGGCRGNTNNFASLMKCRTTCQAGYSGDQVEVEREQENMMQDLQLALEAGAKVKDKKCLLPKDRGPCRASFNYYYYSPYYGTCLQFSYGGCVGNGNRFSSVQDCMKACVDGYTPVQKNDTSVQDTTMTRLMEYEQDCRQPKDIGPCTSAIPAYYFNWDSQKCEHFFYGGCEGNANMYESYEYCLFVCGRFATNLPLPVKPVDSDLDDKCFMVPVHENTSIPAVHCEEHDPFYFYHVQDKDCYVEFYIGCSPGAFADKEDCLKDCKVKKKQRHHKVLKATTTTTTTTTKRPVKDERCLLPKDKGKCKDRVKMYHFDADKETCVSFIYRGCEGNANRFDSHGACMKTCLGVASETLPKTVSSDYVVDWEALQDLSNEII